MFQQVFKMNPYHDVRGRFASANSRGVGALPAGDLHGIAQGRQLTDAQIQDLADKTQISSFIVGYGGSDTDSPHGSALAGLSVEDREVYIDHVSKQLAGEAGYFMPMMNSQKYWYNISYEQKKAIQSMPPDQALQFMLDNGYLSKAKSAEHPTGPSTMLISHDVALKGMSMEQKVAFTERMVEKNPRSLSVWGIDNHGFTTAQKERFADLAEKKVGGGPMAYGKGFANELRNNTAFYSANKDLALTAALSGWAMTGGNTAALKLQHAAATLYGGSKAFYNEEKFNGDYSPRFLDHVRALKAETDAYYMQKFATKTKPVPDLSQKPLTLQRGVGGHMEGYTPMSAESWTTDKGTVTRFGKMMSNDNKYTALSTTTTYKSILWSWESVKGKYGWPPDSALKGKKEHVLLGWHHGEVVGEWHP